MRQQSLKPVHLCFKSASFQMVCNVGYTDVATLLYMYKVTSCEQSSLPWLRGFYTSPVTITLHCGSL